MRFRPPKVLKEVFVTEQEKHSRQSESNPTGTSHIKKKSCAQLSFSETVTTLYFKINYSTYFALVSLAIT